MRIGALLAGGILLSTMVLLSKAPLQAQTDASIVVHNNDDHSISHLYTDTLPRPTLRALLKSLRDRFGIYFLYADDRLSEAEVNEVRLDNSGVESLLNLALAGTGLSYRKVNQNTYVIVKLSQTDGGRSAIGNDWPTVRGRVTDPEGMPVVGASIVVKGTHRATTADNRGEFRLEAQPGEVLLISSVSFEPREKMLTTENNLVLILEPREAEMEEVTVIALGIARDTRSLGYSVSSVDGKQLQLTGETNLGTALEGLVPGLYSSTPLTGPGASSRVTIRGNSSLSFDNQPLYVVNGIPINNDNLGSAGKFGGADFGDGVSSINPDDIESLEVLKGAAAAALYGQRGRNGVILIETIRGQKSGGTRVVLNSHTQVDAIRDFTRFQRQYGQGLQGAAPQSAADGLYSGLYAWGAELDGSPAVFFDGMERPYQAVGGSNLSRYYQTGWRLGHTLAVEGGQSETQWRVSMGDWRSWSVYPNARYNRQTVTADINYRISTKWQGRSFLQYSREPGRNRPNVNDAPGNGNFAVLFLPPNVDVRWLRPGYHSDGQEIQFNDNAFNTNPYFASNRFTNHTDRDRVLGMTQIQYRWKPWLSVQARLAHDYFSFNASSVTPSGTAYKPEGTINLERSFDYNETNADILLRMDRSIGKSLKIHVVAGGNLLRMRASVLDVAADGLAFPFLYSPQTPRSNAVSKLNPRKNVHSLYGSVQLDWKDFLFASVTDRNDWSSTLPAGKNSYNYPSVSVSYLLSKHLPTGKSTEARIRAAYARVGGDAPLFATQMYYGTNGTIGGAPIGNMESQIPNSQLEPLQIREWEWGMEWRFFNRRLTTDLTLYHKETLNDIVAATVSVTSGFQSALVNVGRMVNQGIEWQLSATPVKTETLEWISSFNVAYNNNTVKRLYKGQENMQVSNGESRTERAFIQHLVGQPFGQIMVYDIWKNDAGQPILGTAGLQPSPTLKAAGTAIHPLTGGWLNRVQWKAWTLECLTDFKAGGKIYSGTNATATQRGLTAATLYGRENGVLVQGVDQNNNPAVRQVSAQEYYESLYRISALHVYDASFIKLRSISVGWQLPEKTLRWINGQGSVSIVGRNLFYWMRRTPNIDPEANYSNGNAQGLEYASLPSTRSVAVHFQIVFH